MLAPLLETVLVILVAISLYRYRRPIALALKRFDTQNRARQEQERRDRFDSLAHFRHTFDRAEEQVEAVIEIVVSDPRTATAATRYVFEGEQYGSREEAEHVRAEKVRKLARTFYLELPAALAARRGDGRLR